MVIYSKSLCIIRVENIKYKSYFVIGKMKGKVILVLNQTQCLEGIWGSEDVVPRIVNYSTILS
jgi:hypothetical protein